MNQNMGQMNPNDGGGKRPRNQSYNEALAGFGGIGSFGQTANVNHNQFDHNPNGYGGFYPDNQINQAGNAFPNQNQPFPNQNQGFGNFNPNFSNPNPNFVNQNPPFVNQDQSFGNHNRPMPNQNQLAVNPNVGNGGARAATSGVGPVNRNYKGRIENYVHGFQGSRRGGGPPAPTNRQKVLVKEPEKPIDYAEKLEKLKSTVKYDVVEILKSLDIPVTEEWLKYLEPFAIYVAQQFLIIAGKALKVKPKPTINQESALFMTDEEFDQFLSETSFRKPKLNSKSEEDEKSKEMTDQWD